MVLSRATLLAVFGALGLGGCDGSGIEGSIWQNTLTGDIDTCHADGEGTPYQEVFDYVLVFDGSYVELNIQDSTFATGTISGCEISYDSVVWGETVDGYEVRWMLSGEGVIRPGGSACSMDPGVDWDGTETFDIVYSDHPDLTVGCYYEMTVLGTYSGPTGG